MRKNSQNYQLLRGMLRGKRYTGISALREIGSFRLASRVCDIEGLGIIVDRRPVKCNGKRFLEYFIPQILRPRTRVLMGKFFVK